MPEFLQCPGQLENVQEVDVWISSGPSSSDLFYEADDNLHCVLSGRADFTLIDKVQAADFRDDLHLVEMVWL